MIERTLPFCKNPAGLFSSRVVSTCREVRGCIPTPGHDFGPRARLPRPLTRDLATPASSHALTQPPGTPPDPNPSSPTPHKTDLSRPGHTAGAPRTRTMPEGPNGVPGASGHIEDREAESPGRHNPSTSGVQSRLYSTSPSGPPHPTRINSWRKKKREKKRDIMCRKRKLRERKYRHITDILFFSIFPFSGRKSYSKTF